MRKLSVIGVVIFSCIRALVGVFGKTTMTPSIVLSKPICGGWEYVIFRNYLWISSRSRKDMNRHFS
jgi:hypothetical protein